MGQFSVKTYNPPGSLLSATQHAPLLQSTSAMLADIIIGLVSIRRGPHDQDGFPSDVEGCEITDLLDLLEPARHEPHLWPEPLRFELGNFPREISARRTNVSTNIRQSSFHRSLPMAHIARHTIPPDFTGAKPATLWHSFAPPAPLPPAPVSLRHVRKPVQNRPNLA